jgi:hypothetical protein
MVGGAAVKIKAGTLVRITWEDIQSGDGEDWNDPDAGVDTASMWTVGYVAEDYDRRFRRLVLGGSYSIDDDTIHDKSAYPTGCITRIEILVPGDELWDLPEQG